MDKIYLRCMGQKYKRFKGKLGNLGHSELCCHTQVAGQAVHALYVNEGGNYGYARTFGGAWVHGCLNVFQNGDVSIS